MRLDLLLLLEKIALLLLRMNNIVVGERAWTDIYGSTDERANASWVRCKLSNGEYIYSSTLHKLNTIKEYCIENNLNIYSIGLQFRSNRIEEKTKDKQAVRGTMGGETRYCITLGTLESDGIVKKVAYCIPELVELYKTEDKVEDCFEEMLIYNEQKADKE
jgi:hypothetical protein